MAVHLLKDGRWIVQWRAEGKLRREYFGRGGEAESRARDRNDELGLGRKEKPLEDGLYFENLVEDYLRAREAVMAPGTYRSLFSRIKGVLQALGPHSPYQITPKVIDRYVSQRIRAGRTRTTVHTELTYVMAILNHAVRRQAIRFNPLAGYAKPRRDDRVFPPPSGDEIGQILKHAPPHLARALTLAYYTGIRPGPVELFALRWHAIDWKAEVITVISARKQGPASRRIPLHPEVLESLKAWFETDGRDPNGPLIHYRGHQVKDLKKAWATAKKAAGIHRPLRLYDFRHAFVTALLAVGSDLKSVSEMAGHSRTETTMRVYQHTDLTLARKSIMSLPRLEMGG